MVEKTVEISRISKLKNGWNRTNFLTEKWLKLREFQNWKIVEIARILKLKMVENAQNSKLKNGWNCTNFKIEEWLKLHEFLNWKWLKMHEF